uniref:Uncharacterized protein n=1 Tax=Pseudictyota dubia TaxID=2749911 RepID=A0A6U2EJ39_9STRA|mmetsp:Transcript_33845/g.62670  ORF Transcript_33845/g.62670 Transcript_33845/m.62670 type:complete len:104 (+) Transcript_33845:201-512(+)
MRLSRHSSGGSNHKTKAVRSRRKSMSRLPSLHRLTITASDEMPTIQLKRNSLGGLRRSKQRSLCLSVSYQGEKAIAANNFICSPDHCSDFDEWGHFVDLIEAE